MTLGIAYSSQQQKFDTQNDENQHNNKEYNPEHNDTQHNKQ
jgi:hypothetical protein